MCVRSFESEPWDAPTECTIIFSGPHFKKRTLVKSVQLFRTLAWLARNRFVAGFWGFEVCWLHTATGIAGPVSTTIQYIGYQSWSQEVCKFVEKNGRKANDVWRAECKSIFHRSTDCEPCLIDDTRWRHLELVEDLIRLNNFVEIEPSCSCDR